MQPFVEHIRVGARGREILITTKRRTGLDHWNEICRFALCRSLANPSLPPSIDRPGQTAIEMDWKTFAGPIQDELTAALIVRADQDKVLIEDVEERSRYFRAHLERGIASLQMIYSLDDLLRVDH